MNVLLYFSKQQISLLVKVALVALFLLFSTQTIHAAQVQLSPASGTYGSGQTFTANIQVDPEGKSINAVEAKITFDSTKLSVVSISKTGSVFSLWTTEPTFSNTAGTIDFGGGSPSPFSNKSTLVSVTFRTLAEGSGTVRVTSASALAADGLGTDVYTGAVNGTYTITAASTPTPTPTPTPSGTTEKPAAGDTPNDAAITFGEPPRAPEIGSTVFLDPEIWYPTKIGVFEWDLPFDVDELALDISTSSEAKPTTIHKPAIDTYTLSDELLIEGVQYLTIQYKNQVGWGAILHRKLMIDTEAPLAFTIDVRAGNSRSAFPILNFEAKDKSSGIDHYEMIIADSEPISVTPDEARLGYLLNELEDGTYTVKVTAVDKAGNKTVSTVPVLITAGWHPPVEVVAEVTVWQFFSGKNLVIMLLLAAIIGLLSFMWIERKRHILKEQKLRKETKEIQDQMEKIFSALRDEIYDQINMITKRPRLSKKEKEAVEGLSQALEVSETLIEKEISDVNKILK